MTSETSARRYQPRAFLTPAGGRGTSVLSVVAAAAIMSSSYTLTKVALVDVPPLSVGFIRFALAAVVLWVWVCLRPPYPTPSRADQARLALGGLLGITLYFTIENIGVDLATPTDAALLVAAYPAITVLLELVIYRQRIHLRGTLGIALAIVGVFLVVGYHPAAGPERLIGDMLLIVSGVVWALYNFATRDVASRLPTTVVLYYQTRVGALAFLPLAFIEHDQWRTPTQPATTLTVLLLLGVLCSVAGLGLYAKGLQHLRASTAVNLLNLVPLFGLIIALVTLGGTVTVVQLLGGLTVIAGVTLSTRRSGSTPAPRPPTEGVHHPT